MHAEFYAVAHSRLASIKATGKTIPWAKFRVELKDRVEVMMDKRLPTAKPTR